MCEISNIFILTAHELPLASHCSPLIAHMIACFLPTPSLLLLVLHQNYFKHVSIFRAHFLLNIHGPILHQVNIWRHKSIHHLLDAK